ncbi:hypothetical protein EV363DRAFT_1335123, partial [Boletus edulis]
MKPPCSLAIICVEHILALWIITTISHYRRLPLGHGWRSKLIGIISMFYPYYSSVESDDHNSDSTCSELLGGMRREKA